MIVRSNTFVDLVVINFLFQSGQRSSSADFKEGVFSTTAIISEIVVLPPACSMIFIKAHLNMLTTALKRSCQFMLSALVRVCKAGASF